jgi:hypothetical protein
VVYRQIEAAINRNHPRLCSTNLVSVQIRIFLETTSCFSYLKLGD